MIQTITYSKDRCYSFTIDSNRKSAVRSSSLSFDKIWNNRGLDKEIFIVFYIVIRRGKPIFFLFFN